jgi:hypothetical protein
MKILLAPKSTDGAAPPSTSDLQAQLAAANIKITQLTRKQTAVSEFEKKVNAKIALGLKRDQAAAAVRHQDEFEASDYAKVVATRNAQRHTNKPQPPQPSKS